MTDTSRQSDSPRPSGEPKRKPARRGGALRTIALVTGGLVLLAGLAAAAMVVAPPGWLARDLLARIIQERTGRTLKVEGASRLTLRPDIRLRLEKASLSGRPDSTGPGPLSADSVEIVLKVIDLWSWQFEVPEVALVRPTIVLTRGEPLLERVAEGEIGVGGLPDRISISEGKLVFDAAAAGGAPGMEQLNATITSAPDQRGVTFKGDLAARGEAFRFEGRLGDLQAIGAGAASPLEFTASSALGEVQVKGELATKPIGQIVGEVSARSTTLTRLLAWLELDTGQADLGRAGELKGNIAGSLRRLSLNAASLKLDSLSGIVSGAVSIEEQRPIIRASLTSAKIDLDSLLPSAARPSAFALTPLEGRVTLPTAWDSLLAALERDTAPRMRREPAGARVIPTGPLSSEPFKLTRLPDLDAELTISADELRYGQMPLTNAQLQVTSRPTRLELLVNEASLHQGKVSGRIDLGVGSGPLETELKLKFDRMALDPLVSDTLRQRLLAGVGDVDLAITGRGKSMRELVGSLNGSASLKADKGAVIGFDLRRAILSFGSAQTYDPARRTRFDNLRAGFAIRDGVIRTTESLSMTGPEIDVAASGSLGLVSQRLDQLLRLSLKPPPLHLPIQLRVRGTVADPAVSWDIFSAIADPKKFATPFSVGSRDERMPDEVRAAVTKALAGDAASSRLSPESRAFLEELLRTHN